MTYFIDSLVEAISDFPSFHFRAYPISALSPWMGQGVKSLINPVFFGRKMAILA